MDTAVILTSPDLMTNVQNIIDSDPVLCSYSENRVTPEFQRLVIGPSDSCVIRGASQSQDLGVTNRVSRLSLLCLPIKT